MRRKQEKLKFFSENIRLQVLLQVFGSSVLWKSSGKRSTYRKLRNVHAVNKRQRKRRKSER